MDQLLEVVALDVADALAAVRGGADRLELVSDMATEGLTAPRGTICAVRDVVDVPLRVMVRNNAGFQVSAAELADLCETAAELAEIGVDEVVVGFLTDDGTPDLDAIETVLAVVRPLRWTFHRAFDHASDARAAWRALDGLDGLDTVMSAGSASGVDVDVYRDRAEWQDGGAQWMVGGGLRQEHVPALRALGLRRFHVGRGVRKAGRWDRSVDPAAVERWRVLIDA